MECECVFCVYWHEDRCTLSTISVDILSRCRECVLVDLEAETLAARRQEVRDAFEKMDARWKNQRDLVGE